MESASLSHDGGSKRNIAALFISPAAESMPGIAMDKDNEKQEEDKRRNFYLRLMGEAGFAYVLAKKKPKPISKTTGISLRR